MSRLIHRHDQFFKRLLDKPGTAGALLKDLQQWDDREGRDANRKLLPLPAILTMVVYNGADGWTIPLSLAEVTDADESFRPWLANLHYTLVDLGRIDDGGLSRQEVLRVGFLILKYGSRNGDLRQSLRDLGRAALALGSDELVALVRYVLGEPNEVEAGILRQVLAEIVPGQEDRIMSIAAEQWKAEGRAEGKGDALIHLLERRHGFIPDPIRAQVAGADLATLDRWFDRALDATTLDAVFDDTNLH